MQTKTIGRWFTGVAATFVALAAAGQVRAATYKVDPVHSTVLFRAQHMGAGYVYGQFPNPEGKIVLDSENPAKSSVSITAKADGVWTGKDKRDQHLRSPDFLNAKQFPVIKYESTKVEKAGDGKWKVTGDLTLHGKTRTQVVEVKKVGEGKNQQGQTLAGWETAFTVNRSDFGIDYMPQGVSDELMLVIAVEGIQQ